MDDLEVMKIERACTRLLNEYSQLVDFGNASKLADLFSDDGVWEADDLRLEGPDAIRAHFLKRERVTRRVSRHLVSNLNIEVRSETEAVGVCYFANWRHDRREGDLSLPVPIEIPKYLGEYHDRFRLTPAGWRFELHHVDVSFLRVRAGETGA